MANGFRPPSYMSDAQLSESVQPSWGTVLGQSMGKGVELMLGNWQKRMDRSRQEASALQRQRELLGYKHELGRPERERKAVLARNREGRAIRQEDRAVAGEGRKITQHKQSIKTAEQLGEIRAAAQQTAKEKKARTNDERARKTHVLKRSKKWQNMVSALGSKDPYPVDEAMASIKDLPEKEWDNVVDDIGRGWHGSIGQGLVATQGRRLDYAKATRGEAKQNKASQKFDDQKAELLGDSQGRISDFLERARDVNTFTKIKENTGIMNMVSLTGVSGPVQVKFAKKLHEKIYSSKTISAMQALLSATAERGFQLKASTLRVGAVDPGKSLPLIIEILTSAENAGVQMERHTLDDILRLAQLRWGDSTYSSANMSKFGDYLRRKGIEVMRPFNGRASLKDWRQTLFAAPSPVTTPPIPLVPTSTTGR